MTDSITKKRKRQQIQHFGSDALCCQEVMPPTNPAFWQWHTLLSRSSIPGMQVDGSTNRTAIGTPTKEPTCMAHTKPMDGLTPTNL